ncbi:MAG: PIN domain-containing protein [Patescibacteria group bacterium]
MKYLLDTNVFLRFLVRDSEIDYKECKVLFESIMNSKDEFITTGMVLSEISWVLGSYYKRSREETSEKLNGILKIKGLKLVDNYNWLSAIKIYRENKVKFIDAVLSTIPQVAQKEWTIVSYDEDFKKLPVLWKKPSDL